MFNSKAQNCIYIQLKMYCNSLNSHIFRCYCLEILEQQSVDLCPPQELCTFDSLPEELGVYA